MKTTMIDRHIEVSWFECVQAALDVNANLTRNVSRRNGKKLWKIHREAEDCLELLRHAFVGTQLQLFAAYPVEWAETPVTPPEAL